MFCPCPVGCCLKQMDQSHGGLIPFEKRIHRVRTHLGSVVFLESRIYTKREQHHVRVGNLAGGRRRAEASRRHFAHILVFCSCVGARVGT